MAWKLKTLEENLLIGSTLVEGSTLTEKEAKEVLAGRTVQGHSIQEVRELLNYRTAAEWLMVQVKATPYVSKNLTLDFHARLFQGFPGEHGRWKSQPNYTYLSTGARHDYAPPSQVEGQMARWIDDFNDKTDSDRALARGAELYYRFQLIHPFADGNGRIGRILICYWLHWKAHLAFTFRLKDKTDHLRGLEAANAGQMKALEDFFKKRVKKESGS